MEFYPQVIMQSSQVSFNAEVSNQIQSETASAASKIAVKWRLVGIVAVAPRYNFGLTHVENVFNDKFSTKQSNFNII